MYSGMRWCTSLGVLLLAFLFVEAQVLPPGFHPQSFFAMQITGNAPIFPNPSSSDQKGFELFAQHRLVITHVAVYDHGADGIANTLEAHLWINPEPRNPSSTEVLLASVPFTSADPGVLIAGFRYKPLPVPIVLYQHAMVVVTASGWSISDPFGDPIPGSLGLVKDDGSRVGLELAAAAYRFFREGPANPPAPTLSSPASMQVDPSTRHACASLAAFHVHDFTYLTVPPGFDQYHAPLTPFHFGPKFMVERPVMVTHLGLYDYGVDGIAGSVTVTLWQDSSPVASLVFSAGDDGTLEPGTAMRYKALPSPVRLGCMSTGQITVAGISPQDQILFVNISGNPANDIPIAMNFIRYDMGDAALQPADVYAAGGSPPTPFPIYAGGSFKFEQIMGKRQLPLNNTRLQLIPKNTINFGGFQPSSICIDKRGLMYVVAGNGISILDADLKLLDTIPLVAGMGCAVDDDLNFYVYSTIAKTIFHLDRDGRILRGFGCAKEDASCPPAEATSFIVSLAIYQNILWAQEYDQGLLRGWDLTTGNLVHTIGGQLFNSLNVPLGYSTSSNAIAVHGNYLYAGDLYGTRVQKMDLLTGMWTRVDNDQMLNNLWSVAVDAESGLVSIGESDISRVQILNQCGESIAQTAVRARSMVMHENYLYTADFISTVNIFVMQCEPLYFGKVCDRKCPPCNPTGGRCHDGINGNGACLCNQGYTGPLCEMQVAFKDKFTSFGYHDPSDIWTGENWNVYNLAMGPDGSLFASDLRTASDLSSIYKFSKNGSLISVIGERNIRSPRGLTVDDAGNIYVTFVLGDFGGIYKFDKDGNLVKTYSQMPDGFGGLTGIMFPAAVQYDRTSNSLYLAVGGIRAPPQIMQLNLVTEAWMPIPVFVEEFLSPDGVAPPQFLPHVPVALAIDQENGDLYYVSFAAVVKLRSDDLRMGNFSWLMITNQILNEQFGNALGGGLVVYGNWVYVAEGAGNRVSVWRKDGRGEPPASVWGAFAIVEGNHLTLTNPKGLAYDPTAGVLYIADSGHHRIVGLYTESSECADGYWGMRCEKCSCNPSNGECFDGLLGNGTCSCISPFTGAQCTECEPGYARISDTHCEPCPKGTFSQDGLTCEPCPAGHYNPSLNQAACFPCSTGNFTANNGSIECEGCREGSYADVEGSTSCTLCPPGTFASVGRQAMCTPCNSLSFTNETGAQFCEFCPLHSKPTDARTECICSPGFYPPDNTGTSNVTHGRECVECLEGGDCSMGFLRVAPGYWRSSPSSVEFFACPNRDACQPPINADEVVDCKEGHKGKLCAVCESGFYATGTHECSRCPRSSSGAKGVLAGIVILIIILAILLFTKGLIISAVTKIIEKTPFVKLSASSSSVDISQGAQVNDDDFPFMSIFKSTVSFLQIISHIGVVYRIPWPNMYTEFNSRTSFINFDIFTLSSLECVRSRDSINYYTLLLLITLVPIGLLFLMIPFTWIVVMISKRRGLRASIRSSRYALVRNFLALIFLVYTGVSTRILQIFDCQEFDDGTSWLRADYSVQCHTSLYNKYLVYAVFMIILYPLGFLVTAWVLIHRYRARLDEKKVKESVGILYVEYRHSGAKKEYRFTKYWEIWVMVRKLLLTALITYIASSTIWQVGIATFISVVALVLHVRVEPHIQKSVFNLELVSLSVIAFSFFISIFIRFGSLSKSEEDGLIILILALEMLFFVYAVFLVIKFIYLKIRGPSNSNDLEMDDTAKKYSVSTTEESSLGNSL